MAAQHTAFAACSQSTTVKRGLGLVVVANLCRFQNTGQNTRNILPVLFRLVLAFPQLLFQFPGRQRWSNRQASPLPRTTSLTREPRLWRAYSSIQEPAIANHVDSQS